MIADDFKQFCISSFIWWNTAIYVFIADMSVHIVVLEMRRVTCIVERIYWQHTRGKFLGARIYSFNIVLPGYITVCIYFLFATEFLPPGSITCFLLEKYTWVRLRLSLMTYGIKKIRNYFWVFYKLYVFFLDWTILVKWHLIWPFISSACRCTQNISISFRN